MKSGRDPGPYWTVDVPGLTEEQARWLVSVVNDSPDNLHGTVTDPARWLTVRVDREGAEVLLSGLLRIAEDDISTGLREVIEEWLEFANQDERNGRADRAD